LLLKIACSLLKIACLLLKIAFLLTYNERRTGGARRPGRNERGRTLGAAEGEGRGALGAARGVRAHRRAVKVMMMMLLVLPLLLLPVWLLLLVLLLVLLLLIVLLLLVLTPFQARARERC